MTTRTSGHCLSQDRSSIGTKNVYTQTCQVRFVFRLLLPTVGYLGYCSGTADRSQRKLEFLTLTVLRGGNTHQGKRAKELYFFTVRPKLPLINIYLMSSVRFDIIARGEFKRTPAAHSQKEEKSDNSQEMTLCLCQ